MTRRSSGVEGSRGRILGALPSLLDAAVVGLRHPYNPDTPLLETESIAAMVQRSSLSGADFSKKSSFGL